MRWNFSDRVEAGSDMLVPKPRRGGIANGQSHASSRKAGAFVTHTSTGPLAPQTPNGGQSSVPGLQQDMALTLHALMALGGAYPETVSGASSAEMQQFAQTAVATPEWLQAARLIESTADGRAISLALSLLHDESVYEALIDRFVDQFEYVALQHNQYLLFGERERAELRHIYESFLDALMADLDSDAVAHPASDRTVGRASHSPSDPSRRPTAQPASVDPLRDVVVDHHLKLWQFARSLLKKQLGDRGLWTPPCHEYDPQFQLALWEVQPHELQEPILDLGCGENALLVHYLREAGLEAWGMERFGANSEYVLHGDWLDAPLEPNYWGTIISHMAFSNHFFHHHWRKDGHPERYARRFMEIIDALKPGGRFLYAPGLPFFEPLLPEGRVRVVRHQIDVNVREMVGLASEDSDVMGAGSGRSDGDSDAMGAGSGRSDGDSDAIGAGSGRSDGGADPVSAGGQRTYPGVGRDSGSVRGASDPRQPALYATEIRRL